jgi:thiamine-phosphate pyrophosphorylase
MATGCQLYLSVKANFAGAPSLVEAALSAGDAPSLLLLGQAGPERLAALRDVAHRQNAAVLTEDDYALAKRERFDGVHLRQDGPPVADARAALGADAIVGADCGLSRHDAMTLVEAGADYISFGYDQSGENFEDLVEMVAWWSGLFEVPCVAYLPGTASVEDWRRLVAAGADFILPGPEIWDEAEAAPDLVRRLAGLCRLGGTEAAS